ncbi:MAG: hypothetical protein GC181_14555 [Bacteroidetes bacterium]|nr:hypothetical protein [Bacteroidota bacterium]
MEEVNNSWKKVVEFLNDRFQKRMDMNAILMMIGIRELGQVRDKFTKEEKVRLMHIAICRIFSPSGYYELKGVNHKGWPQWEKVKDLPFGDVFDQEGLLRQHIVEYFSEEGLIEF